ncbi:peptidase M19 [Candidatus Bathyarchaeota archaeon]|nr:MAG: peptidase M19 [Candidatus Bathyarchaeota archaeon]
MLLIDGHLDLAMNALIWNRDLTKSVYEIRRREKGMTQKGRAMGTVAFPEMRKGEVGVCLATLIARIAREGNPFSGYSSPEIAYAMAKGQLSYYRILESQGRIRIIKDLETLNMHVEEWLSDLRWEAPLGFIISMEGADPIINPRQVKDWWEEGLRVVSLSHYGVSTYAHGTGTKGGLTPLGRELLEEMYSIGMILDVTHLSEESFWEALDLFPGHVIASHNNCRALVPGDRQFSDEQIKALIKRDAVIGVALDAWMLYPGWVKGKTSNIVVSMQAVADQIDHICQLAGNSLHAAIGSDLDGGYGKEQCPHDLDTIADLQKIPTILEERGYSKRDIEQIMHGNWLRLFRKAWT